MDIELQLMRQRRFQFQVDHIEANGSVVIHPDRAGANETGARAALYSG
jgi:hypothetical protein